MRAGQRAVLSLVGLGLAAIAFSALTDAAPRLIYNPSPSAPLGFYRVSNARDLRHGDLVLAKVPEAYRSLVVERGYLAADVPLIKRVVALSGDHVCHRDGAIFVNGTMLAVPLTVDGKGRPMPVWKGCRRLEQHEFFALMTDVKASLDSRYFGPLDRALVIGKLEPLWLMEDGGLPRN